MPNSVGTSNLILALLNNLLLLFLLNVLLIFQLTNEFDVFIAIKADTIKRCLPNLHSLGELLLPCFLRQLFTLTVLLSLYVLVKYSLEFQIENNYLFTY